MPARLRIGVTEFSSHGPNLNKLQFGQYGFGGGRTLADYERYAGLRFKTRTVQTITLQNKVGTQSTG